jgi:uncharacterized protein with FMN-binding domain
MLIGSAAVMTAYAAGYFRTQPAAIKLAAAERNRVVIPVEARDTHGAVAPTPPPAPAVVSNPQASPAPSVGASTKARKQKQPARATAADPAPTQTDASAAPAAPVAAPTPSPTSAAPSTPTPVSAAEPTATPRAPVYKDGTYSGWGTSRHGDIEATVVIESGRIASAVISQCWTRYSCSWVAHLQGQVVTRQSPEVDYVSGATQSTNAFYYAVVQALSKAK